VAVAMTRREQANAEALTRLRDAEPVLIDVRPAGEVVPGMEPNIVLTSGAPMPWDRYTGGQRTGVLGGAVYEGLARDLEDADRRLRRGEIVVDACQEHDCIGSLAGIYTASMPVFVVENAVTGDRAFCNFFEGPSPKRLNYGIYDGEVRESLLLVQEVIAPVVAEAVRRSERGIALRPIIRHALHMGDELHSRNTAATLLFAREMFPLLLDLAEQLPSEVRRTFSFLADSAYFFLRLSMAAAKVTADAIRGLDAASTVCAMTFSCREFALRVSGLGDSWVTSRLPDIAPKLFDGYTADDVEIMGGESLINETVGLGGFAQAAAFPLQAYQGGSPDEMVAMNRAMYDITVGEHPEYTIPYLRFRGVPLGIDVMKVLETGITPVADIGVAGRGGGQIGAGVMRMPIECFEAAAAALRDRYGDDGDMVSDSEGA
jgi:hypothetical protein